MAYVYNPLLGLGLDQTGGGGASVAGSDTEIQFNDDGALGASADLTWDDTGKVLGVAGDIDLDDGGTFTTTLQTVTPTAARTISFPDATGTVGLVAGSSGQLLYNASGANAGLSTVTTDGTNVTLTGRFISSLNGAASAPPGTFTGTWFTGGTSTTTKPQVLIEPTGATSTAWSTSGTGLGVNAASGFAGRLLDLQLNGTSNFSVDSTGRVSFPLGAVGTPSLYPGADTNTGFWSPAADTLAASTNGTERARIDSAGRLLVGTTSSSNIATAVFQGNSSGSTNAGNFWLQRGQAPASITANSNIGFIAFAANAGEAYADISAASDGASGSNDYPGRLAFGTTADGAASSTERLRITNDGVIAYNQPAPTSKSAAATLTIAELKTAIVQYTGAADTLTLPTGTLMEGGFSGIYTNMTFEWSVINTGSGTCTIDAGVDHTIVGHATVAAGDSGRFASRRTAANTFVSYRLS
jgi:hypothetical protein